MKKRSCEFCGLTSVLACECDRLGALRQIARAEEAFGIPRTDPSMGAVLLSGFEVELVARYVQGHPYWPSVVAVARAHHGQGRPRATCVLRDDCVSVLRVAAWLRRWF